LSSNDLLRWVDAGVGRGSPPNGAAHLIHTLATIGRPRSAGGVPAARAPADAGRSVELPVRYPGERMVESGRPVANRCDDQPGPEPLL
jgi:hypothetical protein